MYDPAPDPLGDDGDAQHGATLVEEPHDVASGNAASGGVVRMDARRPPGVAVLADAVARNVVEPATVLVVMGVKRKAGMRRDQLQRGACHGRGARAFPAR